MIGTTRRDVEGILGPGEPSTVPEDDCTYTCYPLAGLELEFNPEFDMRLSAVSIYSGVGDLFGIPVIGLPEADFRALAERNGLAPKPEPVCDLTEYSWPDSGLTVFCADAKVESVWVSTAFADEDTPIWPVIESS